MKNKLIKIIGVLAIIISMQQQCFAGFPIGNGRWLLVPTYTRYTANSYWDANGAINQFSNNGVYTSNYLGLYGGFGIGRDVDFIFNIPFVSQSYTENGIDVYTPISYTGDVTVGLCFFLNHFDYYKHLSVTTSLIVPTYPYDANQALLPGFGATGAEVKMGFCGTNTTSWPGTYYDLELGVRNYFADGGPFQFFGNATLGVPIGEETGWTASGTLNFVTSSSSAGFKTPTNMYINRDFAYLRAQLGIGKRLNRNVTLWASIFKDIMGRSIGQGSGFSLTAVFKF